MVHFQVVQYMVWNHDFSAYRTAGTHDAESPPVLYYCAAPDRLMISLFAAAQSVVCRCEPAQRCAVLRRYGYSSIWEMQEVVDNYTRANIPLDVMWGDIDYMERWRDFTFDPVNFPLAALQVRHIVLP